MFAAETRQSMMIAKNSSNQSFAAGARRNRRRIDEPKGTHGETRPSNAISVAVMIGKIATGEIEDDHDGLKSAAALLGRKSGKMRAASMTPERRVEIARKAAEKRWAKRD